jgi:hypothetical protein
VFSFFWIKKSIQFIIWFLSDITEILLKVALNTITLQDTDKLYQIKLYWVNIDMSGIRTYNFSGESPDKYNKQIGDIPNLG